MDAIATIDQGNIVTKFSCLGRLINWEKWHNYNPETESWELNYFSIKLKLWELSLFWQRYFEEKPLDDYGAQTIPLVWSIILGIGQVKFYIDWWVLRVEVTNSTPVWQSEIFCRSVYEKGLLTVSMQYIGEIELDCDLPHLTKNSDKYSRNLYRKHANWVLNNKE